MAKKEKAKTIKVEWNVEDIQEMFKDWIGHSISKDQAENIIGSIKEHAEEGIKRAGFSIISGLLEQLS
jgi:hypothetical protein